MSKDSESEIIEDFQTDWISLGALLEAIRIQFDSITEICILHAPSCDSIREFIIMADTKDTNCWTPIDVYPATQVVVDTGDDTSLSLPYDVVKIRNEGRGNVQSALMTTVYTGKNVPDVEPLDIEAGLALLQKKLNGICPICGAQTDSLEQHYIEQLSCGEGNFSP